MLTNEPVATAGAVTILAPAVVVIGQLTHLYTLSSDAAVALVGAVVLVVGTISTWLARRKVTPTAKLAQTTTPAP